MLLIEYVQLPEACVVTFFYPDLVPVLGNSRMCDMFSVRFDSSCGLYCRTPDMSRMHHDDSSDLKEVAEVLNRVYKVSAQFLT